MADAVGTAGQLKGEPTLTGVLSARPRRLQGAGHASCGPSADRRRRVHWVGRRLRPGG